MIKVFISDGFIKEQIDETEKKYETVKNIEESTHVMVGPGGIGAFSDIFTAIKSKKSLFLYNKDGYYSDTINNLSKGYLEGYIEKAPAGYIYIENGFDNILEDMEEKENDKSNDGKSSKLL